MNDPFDNLSFEEELDPKNWEEETRLHTPTFEALLKADGTLWLSGAALQEGFSVADVQALTRFLSERVQLPEVKPPYEEDPEDYSNYARSTFLERDQEQPEQRPDSELFPPRTVHHVSPQESINEVLSMIERIQHPLSAETQAALDEIVGEQRRRLQVSPEQDLPDAVQAWQRARPAVEQYQKEHPLVDEQICVTCGQPVTHFTVCGRCEKPVHMDNNEACGAWLLDSWHPDAAEDNAFWCTACLNEQEKESESTHHDNE